MSDHSITLHQGGPTCRSSGLTEKSLLANDIKWHPIGCLKIEYTPGIMPDLMVYDQFILISPLKWPKNCGFCSMLIQAAESKICSAHLFSTHLGSSNWVNPTNRQFCICDCLKDMKLQNVPWWSIILIIYNNIHFGVYQGTMISLSPSNSHAERQIAGSANLLLLLESHLAKDCVKMGCP